MGEEMTPKTETAYAIYNERGGIDLGTISSRRTNAISQRQTRMGLTWSECYRRGDRPVTVKITITDLKVDGHHG